MTLTFLTNVLDPIPLAPQPALLHKSELQQLSQIFTFPVALIPTSFDDVTVISLSNKSRVVLPVL